MGQRTYNSAAFTQSRRAGMETRGRLAGAAVENPEEVNHALALTVHGQVYLPAGRRPIACGAGFLTCIHRHGRLESLHHKESNGIKARP